MQVFSCVCRKQRLKLLRPSNLGAAGAAAFPFGEGAAEVLIFTSISSGCLASGWFGPEISSSTTPRYPALPQSISRT